MATETATLGGGCFWCTEAVYRDTRGVTAVQSGYAGGARANPTYEQVCTGQTGHVEVVQIEFDPAEISYADILRVFFTIHDPTTLNRQGADTGTQYRSVIFTHSDAQAATARAVMDEVAAEGVYAGKLVTEIAPAPAFYPRRAGARPLFRTEPLCWLLPGGGWPKGRQVPQGVCIAGPLRRRLNLGGCGEDRLGDHLGHLRHDGVAEGAQAVHPAGNPMSHSTQAGFSIPPTASFNWHAPAPVPLRRGPGPPVPRQGRGPK